MTDGPPSCPRLAALGGMVVPALVYLAVNFGSDDRVRCQGWGIPMATDIAFAIGVVALLGSRVPTAGRLFLLALAIVDDIGAIVVIAIFYTDDLDLMLPRPRPRLAGIGLDWRRGWASRSLAFYVASALIAWYLMLESGVHATLGRSRPWSAHSGSAHVPPRELDRRAGRAIIDELPR